MKYKKNKPTRKQLEINSKEQYDSCVTDQLIRANGLNPATFARLDLKVAQAKIVAHELENQYAKYLSGEQLVQIHEFSRKVADSKKCHLLKPNAGYPILNLATKVKRLAHKEVLVVRQKIQITRYNQP